MKRLPPALAWFISIVLALLFAALGASKLVGPSAMRWSTRFLHWGYPMGSHYAVGLIELAGGLGLLIPRVRKFAAGSLALLMVGAFATHLIHGEWPRIFPPLILGICAGLLVGR